MNCIKCGNVLNEGDMVCRNCGEPVNNVNNGMPTPQQMQPNMGGQPMPASMPGDMNGMGGMPTPQQMQQSQAYQINNMNQAMMGGQPMNSMNQPMNNMNQPMNGMNQPMNGMNNMNGNMPGQAPKKNNMFLIIAIILGIAILGLGSVLVYTFVSDKTDTKELNDNKDSDKEKDDDKTNDKDDDEEDDKEKEDKEKEDGNDNVANDDNIYEVAGYSFIIPTSVKHVVEDGLLTISDGTTYQASLTVDYYSYDEMVANPAGILAEIEETGFTAEQYKEVSSGKRKFFAVYATYNGNGGYFYFTDLDGESVAMGFLVIKTEDGFDKALTVISQIVDTAEYSSKFAVGNGESSTDFNTIIKTEDM